MHVLPFSHRPTILAALAILTITPPKVVNSFQATARLNQSAGGDQAAGQSICSETAPTEFKTSDTRVTWLCDLPEKEEYGHPLVQFLNDRDGWVTTGRKLWKTTDAGGTWECSFDGGLDELKFGRNIRDFQFISAELGWVLTFEQLHKTTDGGRTWRLLSNPFSDGWLRSFKFLEGGKVGFVGGGLYGHLGKNDPTSNRFCAPDGKRSLFAAVFRTEDGGETWRSQPVSKRAGDIWDFYFLDPRHGWAFGEAGDFYLKGGAWHASESGAVDDQGEPTVKCQEIEIGFPTYCPINVCFADSRVGWIVNSNGHLGMSTNGGVTWGDLRAPEGLCKKHCWPEVIVLIYLVDALHAWGIDCDGNLRITEDGGTNWSKLDLELGLEHTSFLDAEHGWAVSKDALYRIAL